MERGDRFVRGDLLWELVHAIMEAETCHHLPSPSWRTRKADGVIWPKFKGLRNTEADGVSPNPRPKEGTEGAAAASSGIQRPENQVI